MLSPNFLVEEHSAKVILSAIRHGHRMRRRPKKKRSPNQHLTCEVPFLFWCVYKQISINKRLVDHPQVVVQDFNSQVLEAQGLSNECREGKSGHGLRSGIP